jgi:hypothetical protein
MRKLWIIAILIIFVLAGCGANPGGYVEDASTTEDTTTTIETTTTVVTTTTTQKPTTTTAPTTTKKPIQKAQVHSATTKKTEGTIMPVKTVSLNVESKNDIGILKFVEAKIDYEYGLLKLFFTLEADRIFEFDYDNIACKDKNGKMLSKVTYGGLIDTITKKDEGLILVNNGSMFFGKVDDATDLSTVTVTYAFEGYDPVTVTFDIPV